MTTANTALGMGHGDAELAAQFLRAASRGETILSNRQHMSEFADAVEALAAQRPSDTAKPNQPEAVELLRWIVEQTGNNEWEEAALWSNTKEKAEEILAAKPSDESAGDLAEYQIETFRHAGNVIFNKVNEAISCGGTEQGKKALRTVQDVANLIVESPVATTAIKPAPSVQAAEGAGDTSGYVEWRLESRPCRAVVTPQDAWSASAQATRRRCAKMVEALDITSLLYRALCSHMDHPSRESMDPMKKSAWSLFYEEIASARDKLAALLQSEFGEDV